MADHKNLSAALRAALDAHPDEAQHVSPEVETITRKLDQRRLDGETVLEDALIKSDLGLPEDRSRAGLERAYLEKMSPGGAVALERNAARG